MSAAVKAMPTPVPPPERRVQWQPPGGSGAAFGGVKINGGNFGSADLPPAAGQPKQQRPQSAVVHSMNRRLTAPGASGLDARRSDDIKIEGFPAGEKSHREVGKMSAEGTSILPHAGGSGGTSGARNRPQSAMPTVNRGGSASAAEKIEIEDLKREILEVTKRIASNRKDLQDSVLLTGAQDGSLQRVQSVEETESALKRFIPTSDSAQVQQAKNALLCTLLQKLEELNRDTLSALNHRHRSVGVFCVRVARKHACTHAYLRACTGLGFRVYTHAHLRACTRTGRQLETRGQDVCHKDEAAIALSRASCWQCPTRRMRYFLSSLSDPPGHTQKRARARTHTHTRRCRETLWR